VLGDLPTGDVVLRRLARTHLFVLTVCAGLSVGGLAIAFADWTSTSPNAVLLRRSVPEGTACSHAVSSPAPAPVALPSRATAWPPGLLTFFRPPQVRLDAVG
jgi:hypothetical protein